MESEPPLPDLYSACFLFALAATPWGVGVAVIILLLLLASSALISGSEVAFFSLTPADLHLIKTDKEPSSKRIIYLRSIPRKLLATILIANNFVNIAIVMVSNYISINTIPQDTFYRWADALAGIPAIGDLSLQARADIVNFTITTVLVTFLLVLFGEVAPKIYAKINNVRLARLMSQPLVILTFVFSPFSSMLVSWSKGLERRLNFRAGGISADKDEIDKAIDLAVSQEGEEPDEARLEADILKSIIKFNDVSVKQIMRARVDVVAADKEMPYDELLKLVISCGYSRIPVYEEDFDNIVGILYVKDLISHRHEKASFRWQNLIRTQVLYVPESKKINDVLKEFQEERVHIGIVVDEYGGSAGIVTLEDVMEEVIGEIHDEFDTEREGDFKQIDDSTFVFDGKMLLNDVCRIIDFDSARLESARGDADSLAGLLLELNGELPKKGEEFTLEDIHFIVLSVTKRRIEKIRVKIPASAK